MTPEELEAIEARAQAATEGEWRPYHPAFAAWAVVKAGSSRQLTKSLSIPEYVATGVEDLNDGHTLKQCKADATFIAAARTDVPRLVAEVRRLQAELKEANWILEGLRK